MVKKLVFFVIGMFLIWFVLVQPDAAAHMFKSIGSGLNSMATNTSHFLTNVTQSIYL